MTPYYADDWLTVYQGDCRAVMASMEPASVHCVVTSPPYWGLRDYGIGEGGIGLEPTPEAYVENMVAVFRAVRRVLRDDGTVWLNLGDSYAGGVTTGEKRPGSGRADGIVDDRAQRNRNGVGAVFGLKPKDLVGIPWRVAFALQADGWVLRSEIVWAKPNPMPESVTDRPTKSHEQIFLFSKGKRIGPDPTPFDDISDSDARWLAAMLDTEGSIVIRRETPKGEDYGGHAAQISVGNTSRALVEEVARIAGSGNVLERRGLNAPMLYWQASNKVALGLLRRVYPYLIVKQRQARCAIALEEGKRYPGGHARLAQTEIARRERLWQAVKSLNHFGTPDLTGIPEPVVGRWTSQPYYFDADAVREPSEPWAANHPDSWATGMDGGHDVIRWSQRAPGDVTAGTGEMRSGRNIRSVWTVATQPYPGAHFATFPEKLIEPCIKAGSSERGVCSECGAPWVRETVITSNRAEAMKWDTPKRDEAFAQSRYTGGLRNTNGQTLRRSVETTGWRPSCAHDAPSVPAVVLDIFAGSGTTGRVAQRLGRRAVLIDLNGDYLVQAMARNQDIPLGLETA